MTLREIGAALGGTDYAAVSIALKRFEAKAKHDRQLRQQQTRLSHLLNAET